MGTRARGAGAAPPIPEAGGNKQEEGNSGGYCPGCATTQRARHGGTPSALSEKGVSDRRNQAVTVALGSRAGGCSEEAPVISLLGPGEAKK